MVSTIFPWQVRLFGIEETILNEVVNKQTNNNDINKGLQNF